MTPKEEAAFAFAKELRAYAIDLVTKLPPPMITAESRRDPRYIGLALLCRSISNFDGSLALAVGQPIEARSLVRLVVENFFFVSALCEHGAEFVKKMRSDEAANRKKLGELSLQMMPVGASKDGGHAKIIRDAIREQGFEFPDPQVFSVRAVAKETVAGNAYLTYAYLSKDAHPSISALRRHLFWEKDGDTERLAVEVVPRFAEDERLNTLADACTFLLGVCIGTNQLYGYPQQEGLQEMVRKLDAQTWQPGKD